MPVNRIVNNQNLSLKPFAESQATDMPRIWAMNGALKVAPSQENSRELKIQLTDSEGEAQTVIVTKNAENQWIRSDKIQNNHSNGLSLDPKSGEVTIEKKFLLFGSKLIVNDTNGKMAQVETNVLFQPVFSQEKASFLYFENHLIKKPIATVAATDEDNKIKEYLFVHTNGAMSARSEDGKYAINTKGEIYLTVSGGGALISTNSEFSQVDSNDYETSTNQFGNYKIVAVDQTNLKSDAITVDFTVNNVLAIPFLHNQTLSNTNGVDSSGHNFSQDTKNKNYQFTTEDADKVLIGYSESGAVTTGLAQGQIENNAVLLTGGGDDYVKLSQSVGSNNMSGGVALGEGNNTLLVGNDIIGGSGRSWVTSGGGQDTIIIGDFDGITDRDDIQNATILTGGGNDLLKLQGGIVSNNSIINLGDGDDTFIVTDKSTDSALRANQSLDGTAINNGRNSAGSVKEKSVIILGTGSDTMLVSGDVDDATIIGGNATGIGLKNETFDYDVSAQSLKDDGLDNGNDTLIIDGYLTSGTIDMGNGNNAVSIGKGVYGSSKINFGNGNDSLIVKDYFGMNSGTATANMGAGDDTVTWNSWTYYGVANERLDGIFNGGSGNDTLIINSTTKYWGAHVTHMHSKYFTGFEKVILQNETALDITFDTFANDTDRQGPLYITTTNTDKKTAKVDFGMNDWNTDTDTNLVDWSIRSSSGNWIKVEDGKQVDNITYDVYRHSVANGNLSDDVYVQQGITII
ncbi:calcium-binding protein [Testudinibacter sp. TR-2022]|nr:calcium-binding protein [Testudinibacter sp. TR-2022]TNH14807.1 calcium-binding protein [Testudinibacter sp. TR-2022]TNH20635.1 calcium-binding protein [Testudinibacter sp. TR-2022]